MAPGLYVHVPFCRRKCPYCDFFSVPGPSLVPGYVEALREEIRRCKGSLAACDTLYVGGGTPSLLPLGLLDRILSDLTGTFAFEEDQEWTIEANPEDLAPERVASFRAMGFHRLSVGVQSFEDPVLRALGRPHRAVDIEQGLRCARRHSFRGLSLDLIYGVPGQSLVDWLKTLHKALAFEPEHLSCYALTCHPRTPFGRSLQRGLLSPLPEDLEEAFFLEASELLERRGYLHYEVSNFARGADHVSRHNSKYWTRTPYLGLGPAAHSFDGSRRWWNVRSIRRYVLDLGSGASPVAGGETLTEEQHWMERLALGVRTSRGLEKAMFALGGEGCRRLPPLLEEGLLREYRERLVPTRKGMLLADALSAYLLEALPIT